MGDDYIDSDEFKDFQEEPVAEEEPMTEKKLIEGVPQSDAKAGPADDEYGNEYYGEEYGEEEVTGKPTKKASGT